VKWLAVRLKKGKISDIKIASIDLEKEPWYALRIKVKEVDENE